MLIKFDLSSLSTPSQSKTVVGNIVNVKAVAPLVFPARPRVLMAMVSQGLRYRSSHLKLGSGQTRSLRWILYW